MNPGEALSNVLARDTRYTIEAYAFVFEALEYARNHLRPKRSRFQATRVPPHPYANHVTGQELCEGGRQLALQQYGKLAPMILAGWGIHETADFGEIVYNMIEFGTMEKMPTDSRADFDKVYDFKTSFEPEFVLDADEMA